MSGLHAVSIGLVITGGATGTTTKKRSNLRDRGKVYQSYGVYDPKTHSGRY